MSGQISRRQFVRNVVASGAAAAAPTLAATSVSAAGSQMLIVNGLDPSALSAHYLDMLQAGGVGCWHRSAGDVSDFAAMLDFCDRHADRIAPARSVREIRQLSAQGKIAHVSGWQSGKVLIAEGASSGSAIENFPAIGHLRAYHELGLRICSIAYNVSNSFGGGCLDADAGLTRTGRLLVEAIHKLRIVLDVGGHTGEQTSFDALAMSHGVPVVCTHTNIRVLNDNPRCSSDRLLEAIARTGGVIGLTAFNDFHARSPRDAEVPRTAQVGLERHLDQYDYLKRLVGVDHIGLGPDFIEGNNRAGRIPPPYDVIMAPEAYSQEMPWLYVEGFRNIGEVTNVARGLKGRGWTDAEVRKVMGENWLRVYERVWGA